MVPMVLIKYIVALAASGPKALSTERPGLTPKPKSRLYFDFTHITHITTQFFSGMNPTHPQLRHI